MSKIMRVETLCGHEQFLVSNKFYHEKCSTHSEFINNWRGAPVKCSECGEISGLYFKMDAARMRQHEDLAKTNEDMPSGEQDAAEQLKDVRDRYGRVNKS